MSQAERSIEYLKLERIDESSSNPRKLFTEMEELAGDIARRGVLQPILVRPRPEDRYELVFGARRFRAARAAGLTEIPAVIQEMGDREVLETQIIENAQREDVHPLEEADGYRALHEQHQVEVDELAARVGKSRAYVYARMKLCALGEKGREAFFDGKLTASTALLIARIQDTKRQAQALKEITEGRFGNDEPMSYREASRHIQRRYMLELKGAPFSPKDAELVAAAGACVACPKRTGAQPELFADVASADVCTDPDCYQTKVDALWKQRTAEAKARGEEVLSPAESKKLFPYGESLAHGCGYIDLDEKNYDVEKPRKWSALIGRQKPPVVHARDPEGRPRRLVKRADAAKALKAAGHTTKKASRMAGESSGDSYRDTMKLDSARDREIRRRVLEAVLANVQERASRGLRLEDLRAIARGVVNSAWADTCSDISKRRGLEPGKDEFGYRAGAVDALVGWIRDAGTADVVGLVVEVLLHRAGLPYGDAKDDDDADLCEEERWNLRTASAAWDVDFDPIADQAKADVTAYVKALKKAKAAKARKKATRKKSAGKKAARKKSPKKRKPNVKPYTRCRSCGCTEDNACDGGCYWVEPDLCSACEGEVS